MLSSSRIRRDSVYRGRIDEQDGGIRRRLGRTVIGEGALALCGGAIQVLHRQAHDVFGALLVGEAALARREAQDSRIAPLRDGLGKVMDRRRL